MKFEVGDILVDAGRDLDAPMKIVEVASHSTDSWGDKYYLKYGEDLYMWLYAEVVEDEWRKAPIGTVAWLIHELSKHDPTDSVSICQWNTHEWKVDVKAVEIINKFEEGAVTLW